MTKKRTATPEWRALRKRVFERDGKQCQKCGYKPERGAVSLEAHHIKPVYRGGTDVLDNLITLCTECHAEWTWVIEPVNNGYEEAGREEFLPFEYWLDIQIKAAELIKLWDTAHYSFSENWKDDETAREMWERVEKEVALSRPFPAFAGVGEVAA